MSKTKLFIYGGNQAVRLPKELQFEGAEVHVRRVDNDVVLSANPPTSAESLIDALDAFEPGARVERDQPKLPPGRGKAPCQDALLLRK